MPGSPSGVAQNGQVAETQRQETEDQGEHAAYGTAEYDLMRAVLGEADGEKTHAGRLSGQSPEGGEDPAADDDPEDDEDSGRPKTAEVSEARTLEMSE